MNARIPSTVSGFCLFLCAIPSGLNAESNPYFAGSPLVTMVGPHGAFVTTVTVASTDLSLGAFSMLIKYDTNKVFIQQIAPLTSNLFAETTSFNSGTTRVAGFQTSDGSPHPTGQMVFQILWKSLGVMGLNQDTSITIEPKAVVDSSWSSTTSSVVTVKANIIGVDSNSDGMPDWWELEQGLDPTSSNNATLIGPNGVSFLQSYLSGVDPKSQNLFHITEFTKNSGGYQVVWTAVPGYSYQVHSTTDLNNPFVPLSGVITAGMNETVKTYTDSASTEPRKFYKVVVVP